MREFLSTRGLKSEGQTNQMAELRYGFIETLIFKMCLESNTINYRGERGLTKLGRILEKGRKA